MKQTTPYVLCLLALCLVTSCSVAWSVSDGEANNTFRLQVNGVVTDATTGSPLAGVPVRLLSAGGTLNDPRVVMEDVTGQEGRYAFAVQVTTFGPKGAGEVCATVEVGCTESIGTGFRLLPGKAAYCTSASQRIDFQCLRTAFN